MKNDKEIIVSPGKKLNVVCEKKTYDGAVAYCEENGRVLASLHDVVNDSLLHKLCRYTTIWNVGLKLNRTERGWKDGTQFNNSVHGKLFRLQDVVNDNLGKNSCVSPVFHVGNQQKLYPQPCNEEFGFFCIQTTTLTTTMTTRPTKQATSTTAVGKQLKRSREMTTIAPHSNANSTPLTIVLPVLGVLMFIIFMALFLYKRRKKNKSRERRKNEGTKIEMKTNPVNGGIEEGAGAVMKPNPEYGGLEEGAGAEMKSNPIYGGQEEGAGAEMKPNPVYGGLGEGVGAEMKSSPVYDGLEEGADTEMKSNPIYGGLEVGAGAEMKSNPIYGGLGEGAGAEMKSNPVYDGLEEGADTEMKPNLVYGGLEEGAGAEMKSNPIYGGLGEGVGAEMKSNPVYGGLGEDNEGLVVRVDPMNKQAVTDDQYSTIPAHSFQNLLS